MNQPYFSRRHLLALGAVAALPTITVADDDPLPVTGKAHANLEPFDQLMTTFIKEHGLPGAALAVTRHSKLVYARGFGYADVEKKEPVQPDALFRIASVSKPITGVAMMQLIEKGKVKIDDKVVDLMKLEAFTPKDAKPDLRWQKITVRHCLQHTGGWDRDRSYDPIVRARVVAKALNVPFPVMPPDLVRYMMGQPLDFDPGERYAYSNLGYLVLGRIIEAITGQKYEAYVKKEVFAPLGIKRAQLGRALLENRAKDEVRYYDRAKRTGDSIYPPKVGDRVPAQYGADNFEAYEAHGGWIASAIDLVKFAAAFDQRAKCPILKEATIEQMWERPQGPAGYDAQGKPKASYYGCGWSIRLIPDGGTNEWHTGYIPGSESILVRRSDGLNWAVLFNMHQTPAGKSLISVIDRQVHLAADKVKAWPDHHLFG